MTTTEVHTAISTAQAAVKGKHENETTCLALAAAYQAAADHYKGKPSRACKMNCTKYGRRAAEWRARAEENRLCGQGRFASAMRAGRRS